MTQLALPRFEATPQLLAHRLFLAIKSDMGATERIARLIQQLRSVVGFKSKALHTEHLHVTLHHLSGFVHLPPEDAVARAHTATDSLIVPTFDAAFNQMASLYGRRGHRPFVLLGDGDVGGLTAFQTALDEVLEHAAVLVQRGPFKSHIILLYDRGGLAARAVEPITWTVRKFAFVHSRLDKTCYDEFSRWALKG